MWKCPKCGREFGRQNQGHYCVKPETIDAYIAMQDEAVQPRLREVRDILRAALPEAQERIEASRACGMYRNVHGTPGKPREA